MRRQLARLRAQSLPPCAAVSSLGTVAPGPAIAANLPADRRGRATQRMSHRANRSTRSKAARDLLALRQRQRQTGSSPDRRHDPSARADMCKNAGRRLAKDAPDRLQALTLLPTLPQLRALHCGKPNSTILPLHHPRSTPSLQGTCCVDQLRAPHERDARLHRRVS